MRVIVLSGAPGVGKTTVGRMLVEHCPDRSTWIDTDMLAAVHPWRADRQFFDLVGANLRAALQNNRRFGIKMVVLSGVVIPGGILDELEPVLREPGFTFRFYALRAHPEVLAARILGDAKPQDGADRLTWSHVNELVCQIPDCTLIDTSRSSVSGVVARLVALEGLRCE